MKQNFKDDFDEMITYIRDADAFALSRYADGEANILKNNTVGNKDGWLYRKDRNLPFRRDLRQALQCKDTGFVYGISCTCCDPENHAYLLENLKAPIENLTFSNIFVNANFQRFSEEFLSVLKNSGKKIHLFTGKKARIQNLERFFNIDQSYLVPGNCVTYWEKNKENMLGQLDLIGSTTYNAIFLFALGPLSEILIYELWNVNHKNIYIDIGSTLDPYLFNRKSRVYHQPGSSFSSKICTW